MTDRLKGCTVTFDHDIRDDDAKVVLDAIRCLRGVLHVEGSVSTLDDRMNRIRVRAELRTKLLQVLDEPAE